MITLWLGAKNDVNESTGAPNDQSQQELVFWRVFFGWRNAHRRYESNCTDICTGRRVQQPTHDKERT